MDLTCAGVVNPGEVNAVIADTGNALNSGVPEGGRLRVIPIEVQGDSVEVATDICARGGGDDVEDRISSQNCTQWISP